MLRQASTHVRNTLMLVLLTSFFIIPMSAQEIKTQETIALTKKNFLTQVADYEKNSKEWIYLGDKPCVIDFYATWCGPCKRIAPILEELAQTYKGEIYFYKVDTDIEKELAQDFGIQSIPTLLFCPTTGNPSISNGAMTKEDLIKIIDKQLLSKKK